MPSKARDDESSSSSSSDSEDEEATPFQPGDSSKGLTLLDDETNTELVLPPDDRGEAESCEFRHHWNYCSGHIIGVIRVCCV